MLDLRTIESMSRDRAKRAAKEHLEPYVVWPGDIRRFPPFPFPSIGNYRPRGWKLVRTLFVDSSGFGADDEPALTIDRFIKEIKTGFGYAVIQEGEFQVYIGEFTRRPENGNGRGRK